MSARRPLRILAAIGPGDVVAAHDDWVRGIRTVSETSLTFSGQEFEAFRSVGAAFWAVSSHPRAERRAVEGGVVENRPKARGRPVRGLGFHVAQLAYAVSLLRTALSFHATHAVVDSGTAHWFSFALFRAAGIAVVPNLHNVQWNEGHAPTGRKDRVLRTLDAWFFRTCVRDAIGVSTECGRQIAVLSSGKARFHEYRAQFAEEDFAGVPPPPDGLGPFHVLFVGRVERNKGVFDLLRIAEALAEAGHDDVVIDVCGGGGALEELREAVRLAGLERRVRLHGKLARPDLLEAYARSRLVVVPTRSDFCEGLPMVCAEAVLAGRPVVTSRVSNALDALRDAVVEARVDDADDFARAIASVRSDPALRRSLAEAAPRVGRQFVDRDRGLAAVLARLLADAPDR